MAKKVEKVIKLQLPAGKATPAPPVGTMLGPVGINLNEFCTKYNDATKDKMGSIVPVEISVYEDRSFDFVLKTPPTPSLLLEVAEIKLPDLNTNDIEAAMRIVAGTARNMGIAVKGLNDAELAEQAEEAKEAEAEMAKLDAELEEMEAQAKAMADADMPEVESTEQKDENETSEE